MIDDLLTINTHQVKALCIDADGNIGIGTTNPTQKLQVTGQGFFTSSSTSPDPGDSSETGIRIGYQSTDDYGYINANTTGVAAKRLTLQQNGGNVGIGTTKPRNPVGIRATGNAQELLSFEDPSGQTKWHINQALNGNLGLNVVETGVADGRLFIQAGGNVGIGTTTPSAKLTVDGSVGVTGDINFHGDLIGKHGNATNAHIVPLFAENLTNVMSITLPVKQKVFAFVALTSINLLAAQSGAGGFATIDSIDDQPHPDKAKAPMNMTWSGEAQKITFNLFARKTQAWALGVVFPIGPTV